MFSATYVKSQYPVLCVDSISHTDYHSQESSVIMVLFGEWPDTVETPSLPYLFYPFP